MTSLAITRWHRSAKVLQGRRRKSMEFDPRHPKSPEPMVTKICMGDYVQDIYRNAKFHYEPIREFCPYICELCV